MTKRSLAVGKRIELLRVSHFQHSDNTQFRRLSLTNVDELGSLEPPGGNGWSLFGHQGGHTCCQ